MKPLLDASGTAAEAAEKGVTRRTIQRHRAKDRLKRLKESARLAAEPALPGIPEEFIKPPAPKRLIPEEAAARAGALESITYRRAMEAAAAGDPYRARLWIETWARVQATMRHTETYIQETKEHKGQLEEFNEYCERIVDGYQYYHTRRNPPAQSLASTKPLNPPTPKAGESTPVENGPWKPSYWGVASPGQVDMANPS